MRFFNIMGNILKKLEPIFQAVFEDANLKLTESLNANDVENWDSLNHITLIVEVEEFTGVSFSTDDLIDLENVGDFAKVLEAKGFTGDD